jgi:hypothetical protein
MTTLIGFHEVKDGAHWAKTWQKGDAGREAMFAKAGVVSTRTFKNPDSVGVLFDVDDMEKFQTFMDSDDAKQAMDEDGLKVETLQILVEFTP